MDEYLVSYGQAGTFGRFRTREGANYCRGHRVVVRTHRGFEIGTVLCPATEGHARFLSKTQQGEILRREREQDKEALVGARRLAQLLIEEGAELVNKLNLPLEILDVEVLLDGKQAVVHHLRAEDCDFRPLVSALSRKHDIFVVMENLALPKEAGCGKPGCGQAKGGGGCDSCGSGGGCGTCGAGTKKEDVAAHLALLRSMMEDNSRRMSLV